LEELKGEDKGGGGDPTRLTSESLPFLTTFLQIQSDVLRRRIARYPLDKGGEQKGEVAGPNKNKNVGTIGKKRKRH